MTKEELIDRFRDINTDHEWYGHTIEHLRYELFLLGFNMTDARFSGFYSQGDGAQFTGYMQDWEVFCEMVPNFVSDCPNESLFLQREGGDYTIDGSGSYNHEKATFTELEMTDSDWLEDNEGDDMETTMLRTCYSAIDYKHAKKWLDEYFRERMRELYRDLELEYEYLTSDDMVWESIVANGLGSTT